MFLSLGRYLCCWTISPRGYHQHSSQCFYHWVVFLSLGRYLCCWTISPPSRISSAQSRSVFLSLGRYLCCWTISPRGYHQHSSQCFYHWVDTSVAVVTISGLLVPDVFISTIVSVSAPLVFLLPHTFKLFDFPIFRLFSVPDEGYSRDASCALDLISTFLS